MPRPALSSPTPARPDGPKRWRVRAYQPAPKTVGAAPPSRGQLVHQLELVALAKDAQGKAREKLRDAGHEARSINFGPGDTLIATVASVPAKRRTTRAGKPSKKLRVVDKRAQQREEQQP